MMLEHFGFGDFVFRRPDGTEVDRAADLRGLEEMLATVPEESIVHHAGRNHFSRWLKARTEFALADELRPRRLDDYASTKALRESLIQAIAAYRLEQSRTLVTDFDRDDFDLSGDFYRMGGGSLGGKARGLAFVRRLLARAGPAPPLRRRRDRGADLGRARHRRLRPLPRRQRPALLRDRVRGRRGDQGPLPRRALPGGGGAGRRRLPRARHLAARGALLEPARGLAAPAVHRRLRHADAGEQLLEHPGAAGAGHPGDQAGLRLDLLASTRRPTSRRRPTGSRRRRWR